MKRFISVLLAVTLAASALTLFAASASAKAENVSLRAYCEKFYSEKKSLKRAYKCKVKYNEQEKIKVKFSDDGSIYTLTVRGLKVTDKACPVVKIYYVGSDKKVNVVKCLRFRVYEAGTVKFKNRQVNEGTSKEITVNNPFAYSYKLKLSKQDIVKFVSGSVQDGIKVTYAVKGLKKGSVTVKAYLSGKNVCVGSFKITVGDYPAKIRSEYNEIKLKYNAHGSSTYMTESHVKVADMIEDRHAKAKYAIVPSDESVISTVSEKLAYAVGTGSATAEITEILGGKTKTIGTVKIKVVNAKTAYVVKQNASFYNDGIFGNGDFTEFLNLTDCKKFSMHPIIDDRLLNNPYTGSSFKSSDYSVYYTSSNAKVIKVSSKGVVTALKTGSAAVSYTITFKDKSTFKSSCQFLVEKD